MSLARAKAAWPASIRRSARVTNSTFYRRIEPPNFSKCHSFSVIQPVPNCTHRHVTSSPTTTRFHRLPHLALSPQPTQSGAPLSLRSAFTRSFHSTPPRTDVFFVTVPEFKETLLLITRVTLVALPLAWRWGVFRRFPSGARTLIWLPLASLMIVVGLGLQQSPKTARWRLLLMSESAVEGGGRDGLADWCVAVGASQANVRSWSGAINGTTQRNSCPISQ